LSLLQTFAALHHIPFTNEYWCTNRDAESRFLEYAKYAEYSVDRRRVGLPETEDESTPYRYVRTFKEVERSKLVTEMDKDELQAFINELLGAKGLDTTIPKTNTN